VVIRYLDLSSNGMAHLAIRPMAEVADPAVTAAWEEIRGPDGVTVSHYYNRVSGESKKGVPEALKLAKLAAEGAALGKKDLTKLVEGSAAYNSARAALAAAGVPEYSAIVDTKAGNVYVPGTPFREKRNSTKILSFL